MCAAAYVLLLRQVDQRIATETQAALLGRAAGVDVDLPDPAAIRARFDDLLCAPPVRTVRPTSREGVIREAFGLTGGESS